MVEIFRLFCLEIVVENFVLVGVETENLPFAAHHKGIYRVIERFLKQYISLDIAMHKEIVVCLAGQEDKGVLVTMGNVKYLFVLFLEVDCEF